MIALADGHQALRVIFSGPSGAVALNYLRQRTIEKVSPATAPDAVLRHLEGQRELVKWIEHVVSNEEQSYGQPEAAEAG